MRPEWVPICRRGCGALWSKFKVVGDVRGVGLMAGIEMVSDKAKLARP
jgi:4-aminobutyrate aminotransferase-like enzyme